MACTSKSIMRESSRMVTYVHKCVIHFCAVWFGVFLQEAFLLIMYSPSLQMSMTPYVGFAAGACRSTRNLSFVAWVIYDPHGELIDLQGICLGHTNNNIAEYVVVIELLSVAIALDI